MSFKEKKEKKKTHKRQKENFEKIIKNKRTQK